MTFSQFAQQQALNDLSNLKSAVEGMPPGFIVGFEIIVAKDGLTIIIGAGICNIGGRQVSIKKPILLENRLFESERGKNLYYYIYVNQTGEIKLSSVKPVDTDERYGQYHPEYGWLSIGSIFIDESGLISESLSHNTVVFEDIIVRNNSKLGGFLINNNGIFTVDPGMAVRSTDKRFEVVDSEGNVKVAIGYLQGIEDFTDLNYGLYLNNPDTAIIAGGGESRDGDWLINSDAAYVVLDSLGNIVSRLGNIGSGHVGLTLGPSVDPFFRADESGLELRGTIYAASGEIGGWTIANERLSAGVMEIKGDGSIVTPFVTIGTDGKITATQANFSGAITATSGSLGTLDVLGNITIGVAGSIIAGATTLNSAGIDAQQGNIGGFTLSANTLSANNLSLANTGDITAGDFNNVVRISSSDAAYRLWIGNSFAPSAPFRVTPEGEVTMTNLKASGGAIGGFTVSGDGLTVSDGPNKIGISAGEGIYLGGDTPETAPFHVSPTGFVKANYINLVAPTISTSLNPEVNRIIIDTNGIVGYDTDYGMTFKIPTDGSAPFFANGVIEHATISHTTIESTTYRTSNSLPWVEMTEVGLAYREAESSGQYGGGQKYGTAHTYGVGVTAYLGNPGYPTFCATQLRNLADIRLYNRLNDPVGPNQIGDLACVNGKMKICTAAGSPGTWTVVGNQT